MNHVHIDDEAMETALVISSFWSGKYFFDLYKNHPSHQDSIDK